MRIVLEWLGILGLFVMFWGMCWLALTVFPL